MAQYGFWYDMSACVGCHACHGACAEAHGLQMGEFFRRVAVLPAPGIGALGEVAFSSACHHCHSPACVAACPTGAMYKREEDGMVLHDDSLCIACGGCVWSCPYGAPSFSRVTGLSQKCDGCEARRKEGKQPACVGACPTRSLRFGNVEELCRQLGGAELALPFLPAPEETEPSTCVVYPAGKGAVE